jgi:Multiubiquitin
MVEKQSEGERKHQVRIHIDEKPYESSNPTTGAALYTLGNVAAGLELYREVSGDREDKPIENSSAMVHLTEDEHFHSGTKPKYRIIVNLEAVVVDKNVLSFREVVKLAYPNVTDGPDVVYSVTYKKAVGPHREGTLAEGQSVEIKNGTIISVTRTDKS